MGEKENTKIKILGECCMFSETKVSVIIPVYNTENYLRECLDSVTGQTLDDVEIICVNDGSTDNSLDILRKYAGEYENFRIISQKNKGLSEARNTGLAMATGKYVYFLDSDDKLAPEALDQLWQVSSSYKTDVVLFSGTSFCDASFTAQKNNPYFETAYLKKTNYPEVLSGKEMLAELIRNGDYATSVCLQFISREFLKEKKLKFVSGILHEDNIFTLSLMFEAKRVRCINDILFYRRLRADSIITRKETYKNMYGYYHCFVSSLYLLDDKRMTEFQKEWILRIPYRILGHVKRMWFILDKEQQECFLNICTPFERLLFQEIVKKYIEIEVKCKRTESELKGIKESISYKIGRVATKVPREIRRIKRYIHKPT